MWDTTVRPTSSEMEDRRPRVSCWAAPSRCCSTATASAAAMGCSCRPCLLCLPACASAGRAWSAPRQARSLCRPVKSWKLTEAKIPMHPLHPECTLLDVGTARKGPARQHSC